MFGSIGWAVAMFFMGMVLDHSHFDEATSRCDVNDGQKNYHVCFYVFAFFMLCALLVATQIPFRYKRDKYFFAFGLAAKLAPFDYNPIFPQPPTNSSL
jgi:Na+/melibiose symporter-like transporter